MRTAEVLVLVWRGLNVAMAVLCLIQLVADVAARRRLHLRARFYWEAVALMLVSIIWSTIEAIVSEPAGWNPARTAIVTVALIYFLISTYRSRLVRAAELRGDWRDHPDLTV
jgi:hypothetical protein